MWHEVTRIQTTVHNSELMLLRICQRTLTPLERHPRRQRRPVLPVRSHGHALRNCQSRIYRLRALERVLKVHRVAHTQRLHANCLRWTLPAAISE